MSIKAFVGLGLSANGALIALNSVGLYSVNWVGLVLGGVILLGGVYMVVREELD